MLPPTTTQMPLKLTDAFNLYELEIHTQNPCIFFSLDHLVPSSTLFLFPRLFFLYDSVFPVGMQSLCSFLSFALLLIRTNDPVHQIPWIFDLVNVNVPRFHLSMFYPHLRAVAPNSERRPENWPERTITLRTWILQRLSWYSDAVSLPNLWAYLFLPNEPILSYPPEPIVVLVPYTICCAHCTVWLIVTSCQRLAVFDLCGLIIWCFRFLSLRGFFSAIQSFNQSRSSYCWMLRKTSVDNRQPCWWV